MARAGDRPARRTPEHHAAVLAAAINASHAQLDRALSSVTAEYVVARDRAVRGALAAQAEIVDAVLAGEPIDEDRTARRLRYDLSGAHVAWVLWASAAGRMPNQPSLEGLAPEVGGAIAGGASLVLPRGEQAIWGWTHSVEAHKYDAEALRARLSSNTEVVHVAFGEPAVGSAGFRASHRQALRAQSAVLAGPQRVCSVTGFADVALITLLLENPEGARSFVRQELGPLADDRPSHVRLRQTLRRYYESDASSAETARALHMHRNSVLYRLQRIEALLEAPVGSRSLERHAALVLAEWLSG